MNPGEVTPAPVSGGFAQSWLVLGAPPSGVLGRWPFVSLKASTSRGLDSDRSEFNSHPRQLAASSTRCESSRRVEDTEAQHRFGDAWHSVDESGVRQWWGVRPQEGEKEHEEGQEEDERWQEEERCKVEPAGGLRWPSTGFRRLGAVFGTRGRRESIRGEKVARMDPERGPGTDF